MAQDRERLERLLTSAEAERSKDRSADAIPLLREAVEVCRDGGDSARLAHSLTRLGQMHRDIGEVDNALALYLQAVAFYRELNDPQRLAHTIRHVADIQSEMGVLAEAETNYLEALAFYRSNDAAHPVDLANTLRGFALLLERKGDRLAARRAWEEAGSLYANAGIEAGVEECSKRAAALTG